MAKTPHYDLETKNKWPNLLSNNTNYIWLFQADNQIFLCFHHAKSYSVFE
ncbi:hypothetical protein CPS_3491 [Colwellia psychrerythraea 34H]|uniref:Uncharacterized protein n=1 Tax=Colwellia psychrerythraea (strain 34H / ATCC BAA-681) TaxID=167879 RepID=Q47YF5_COLP3|nr:hypothetical protein CPS_3491 [Colwellia psychrerythraea 34H]